MSKTIAQSEYDALTPAVAAALVAQGFEIVPDATETPAAGGASDLLAGVDQGADDKDDSDLFLNVYVVVGKKRFRLTYASLDSDFVRYTDKENTKPNTIRDAVVDTVAKHGLDKAAEGIKFEVELNQAGHSASIGDLLNQ